MSATMCRDCTHAKALPVWGGYTSSCLECTARAIARSHQAFDAWSDRGNGQIKPLRDLVSRLLPNVPKDEAKRLVRGWWEIYQLNTQEN